MPIYEYVCQDCQHRFETLVTASRQPACPVCESHGLEKQHSVFAVSTRSNGTSAAPAGCGTCGDPRGPGSCSLN